jgi:hypothetical protein
VQCNMFAPPHAQPQLQALQSIEPSDALAIHQPAFASEQDPDPEVAEPWSGMGQIPNAKPETGLIRGPRRYQAVRLNWANRQARRPLTWKVF